MKAAASRNVIGTIRSRICSVVGVVVGCTSVFLLFDAECVLRDLDEVTELGVTIRPRRALHAFDLLEGELVSRVFFAEVARTQMLVSSFMAMV